MVLLAVFVFATFLAISHSSAITELPEIGTTSKTPELLPSTSLPDKTTRGPHTHDEHPADDPDHSDHVHEASESTVDEHDHSGHDHHDHSGHDQHDHSGHGHDHSEHDHKGHTGLDHHHDHSGHIHKDHSGQDEHDHPGHDHSESGHSHEDDHKEEMKSVSDDVSSIKVPKEEPEKVDDIGNRARRGLWRRRID